MSDGKIADWLVVTALAFGASVSTAYQVAGLFIAQLEKDRAAEQQFEGREKP